MQFNFLPYIYKNTKFYIFAYISGHLNILKSIKFCYKYVHVFRLLQMKITIVDLFKHFEKQP